MNNNFKKFTIGILICTMGLILAGGFVHAQTTYQIHEKIPGQAGKEGVINGVDYGKKGVDTLQDYLESAYKFGIAIVAILAVVMIGIGAFMYIVTSAGNAGKLANAKEMITSAILGLVMALLSWLILFVINPDLVGNTLKSIKITDGNNDWKQDKKADPKICNTPSRNLYQVTRCKGDYVCQKDTCKTKGSISCTDSDIKFPGVCSENDSVAHVNDPCGISTGSKEGKLAGKCMARKCSSGLVEFNLGKQCIDTGNHCCARGL